jgi:cysteine desulfuration protein SufE
MTQLEEREKELISEFEMFEDWMEKYEYIIDLGKELPALNQDYKVKDNLIKGCQSQVWLHAFENEGMVQFEADSDAFITKGLVALVIRVLSGSTPSEIIESDLGFIQKIGLQEHLSPIRSNGLISMVKQMKNYAFALQNK